MTPTDEEVRARINHIRHISHPNINRDADWFEIFLRQRIPATAEALAGAEERGRLAGRQEALDEIYTELQALVARIEDMTR